MMFKQGPNKTNLGIDGIDPETLIYYSEEQNDVWLTEIKFFRFKDQVALTGIFVEELISKGFRRIIAPNPSQTFITVAQMFGFELKKIRIEDGTESGAYIWGDLTETEN